MIKTQQKQKIQVSLQETALCHRLQLTALQSAANYTAVCKDADGVVMGRTGAMEQSTEIPVAALPLSMDLVHTFSVFFLVFRPE